MHSVELFERATAVANDLGYGVRQEWLGGCGGGACEIAGRKWIFVDLSLGTSEQLGQLIEALRQDPGIDSADLPPRLAQLVHLRRAA